MEKSPSMFIKIDEFIFKKLDLIKSEGVFQKFNDSLSGLDEAQQKTMAQVLAFFFILTPFLVVIFLWWGNFQMKKGIDVKKQIIEQIAVFEGNQTALNNISASYLAPSAINAQPDLEAKIRNILSQNSIDQDKVSVRSFRPASTSGAVAKIEADLTFKNFGTTDFSVFMRAMIENERFKIIKVDLAKDKENNLLQGSLSMIHMGQNLLSPGSE